MRLKRERETAERKFNGLRQVEEQVRSTDKLRGCQVRYCVVEKPEE